MYKQNWLQINNFGWGEGGERERGAEKLFFVIIKKKFRVPYKKIVYECHIILKEHECLWKQICGTI